MSEDKRPLVRGHSIPAETLLGQVQNTAPFLFATDDASAFLIQSTGETGYLEILRAALATPVSDSDLWSYYDLCLASHFATVGTFVPTDVDLAIRLKLWSGVHHEGAFLPMWNRIQEFHEWDESFVSKRWVYTSSGRKLSGHQGEWFTVAMGAYGAVRKVAPEYLGEVREAIEVEFKNQEAALTELFDTFAESSTIPNMKALLGGIAAVAHNLGDLDRMFDAWEVDDHDVLKRRVYRAGHEDARVSRPSFLAAGKIYQSMLAHENHRHFALREPKCLRQSPAFLLPFGPFFDDWGQQLVENKLLDEGQLRTVAEALILGWKKLNPLSIYTSQGYARALSGMAMAYGNIAAPGMTTAARMKAGREVLVNLVPPVLKKELNEGGLRTLMALSQSEFEKKWLVKLRGEIEAANLSDTDADDSDPDEVPSDEE